MDGRTDEPSCCTCRPTAKRAPTSHSLFNTSDGNNPFSPLLSSPPSSDAEFIAIGNKAGALNLLHEVLSQRKVRTWQKSYETIMVRYIDLCIDLRDYARGKDGLHQYRNLSQAQAPGSLEVSQ